MKFSLNISYYGAQIITLRGAMGQILAGPHSLLTDEARAVAAEARISAPDLQRSSAWLLVFLLSDLKPRLAAR